MSCMKEDFHPRQKDELCTTSKCTQSEVDLDVTNHTMCFAKFASLSQQIHSNLYPLIHNEWVYFWVSWCGYNSDHSWHFVSSPCKSAKLSFSCIVHENHSYHVCICPKNILCTRLCRKYIPTNDFIHGENSEMMQDMHLHSLVNQNSMNKKSDTGCWV